MLVLNSGLQSNHLHDKKPFVYFLCLPHMGKAYSQQQWVNIYRRGAYSIYRNGCYTVQGGRKLMFFKGDRKQQEKGGKLIQKLLLRS